jgi:hypothetical protein
MNRNRTAGHRFELIILQKLKSIFPKILTSRNESRAKDAQKIDFCNTGPYQLQAKLTMNFPGVNILDEMPEGKNVLIWGKVEKVNTRFMQRGTYAIMDFELFKELINGQVR